MAASFQWKSTYKQKEWVNDKCSILDLRNHEQYLHSCLQKWNIPPAYILSWLRKTKAKWFISLLIYITYNSLASASWFTSLTTVWHQPLYLHQFGISLLIYITYNSLASASLFTSFTSVWHQPLDLHHLHQFGIHLFEIILDLRCNEEKNDRKNQEHWGNISRSEISSNITFLDHGRNVRAIMSVRTMFSLNVFPSWKIIPSI